MKNLLMKRLLTLAITCGALVACSSNKPPVEDMKDVASAPAPVEVASAPVVSSAPVTASNHNSVYFAFDKYNILDQYNGLIAANASYMAKTSQAKVQIQGNTDDIGSVEYNLSLGQRRADAVKKALIANGVSGANIEATSNGKLKAKYPNDNPASRSLNRRSDIIYTSNQPSGYSIDSNGIPMVDSSVYDGAVIEGVQ